MALLTIVIPSTYYTTGKRPKMGLTGGEIEYDVTAAAAPGDIVSIAFEFVAAVTVTDIVLRLSITDGVGPKTPTLKVDDPGTIPPAVTSVGMDGEEAVFKISTLAPNGMFVAIHRCEIPKAGWQTSRFAFEATELERAVRGKVPMLVEAPGGYIAESGY